MGGRIKIALALFVLLMLPLGLLTSCQTTAKSGLAATVNGEEITDKDLDKEYKKISKRFEGTPQGAMADEQKKRMQKQLLLSLMENILMEQQAEKAGVKISKKEIDKRFKQFQTGRSKKEFTEQLKQAGLTQTTLKDQIGDNLLREQLRKK
ncbi:MAG: SurA N-terminal domain-containing protein, partial [Terriglobia bacterium]